MIPRSRFKSHRPGCCAGLKGLRDPSTGVSVAVRADMLWYNESTGTADSDQARTGGVRGGSLSSLCLCDRRSGSSGAGCGVVLSQNRPVDLISLSTDPQAGGAYIFRPNGTALPLPGRFGTRPKLSVVRGPIVSEVRMVWADWASAVVRVYSGQGPHAEVAWTAGPVPIEDGLGKSLVLRLSADMRTGGKFWTDSNAREMVPRERDSR